MTVLTRGAVLVAGMAAVACATNPVTGKSELSLISESQEISMGQEAAKDVAASIGIYQDQQAQALVSRVGQKMAAASERPNLPWSFQVVDDPAVNAFALPGGFIFVTRGLMTHLNNEAELASVIGHEIGHVTAKHSVQQMSRAQVAQLGLGIGSILSSDVAKYAGLASTGLSLLFLKYGRDDESQADGLGFRYALNAGYDVREMDDVFQTLQRVSQQSGGSGLPEWLSTHPDPGNRIQATQHRLDTLSVSLANKTVGRDQYLQVINNMVFGDDPRQGYFANGLFLHPGLRFQLQFPSGWQAQNQTSAVIAVSPNNDAAIQLTLAGQASPTEASSQFFNQQGIQAGQTSRSSINGNPAVSSSFQAQTDQGTVQGLVTFIQYNGTTFQILGYTAAGKISTYNNDFLRAATSFRQLTDQAALNVQPKRVEVVKVPRAMTLEQFYQQYPSAVPIEQIAIINELQPGQTIAAGTMVKRVKE